MVICLGPLPFCFVYSYCLFLFNLFNLMSFRILVENWAWLSISKLSCVCCMQSFFLFLKVLKPVEAEAATNYKSRLMKMDKIKDSFSFQQEIYCVWAAWTGIKMFDETSLPPLPKPFKKREWNQKGSVLNVKYHELFLVESGIQMVLSLYLLFPENLRWKHP